jgi:hypothetical protein
MSKKQPWNVWRIKNRWLRSLFSTLVMAPALLALLVFSAFVSVAAGAVEGSRHAWWLFTKHQDGNVYRSLWRAITFREAA